MVNQKAAFAMGLALFGVTAQGDELDRWVWRNPPLRHQVAQQRDPAILRRVGTCRECLKADGEPLAVALAQALF
jgi:hypothetical protein